ncbi:hypothetical protein GCM10020219_012150 [Nonomuraea dietziae]
MEPGPRQRPKGDAGTTEPANERDKRRADPETEQAKPPKTPIEERGLDNVPNRQRPDRQAKKPRTERNAGARKPPDQRDKRRADQETEQAKPPKTPIEERGLDGVPGRRGQIDGARRPGPRGTQARRNPRTKETRGQWTPEAE